MKLSTANRTSRAVRIALVLSLTVMVLTACNNMRVQDKIDEPYGVSENFGTAARDILPETVPVGFLREDTHMYEGTIDGEFAETLPIELNDEVFFQGQLLFENFCAPCHGFSGYGDGVLSEEGFPKPASFHDEEIRDKPVGHYFDVITNGQNAMFSYASRVQPEDRWAIIAYIRALQLSQHAPYDELPTDIQAAFDEELE